MINHVTLIIIIILLFSCSTEKNKAIEHYMNAKELYKNDDIKNAISEIDLAIRLDSSNLDFQVTKAKIISETGNSELAIEILKKIASKKFKLDSVNFQIGSCYFDYGNHFLMKEGYDDEAKNAFERALNYYNKAININTQYFEAYVEKQKVLHNLERYDEAIVVLNTAINLFPDNISLICNRGVEKIYLGDLTGGLSDLNKSIQSNKLDSLDFSTAYRFRGALFLKKEKLNKAINDLTSALKYNPKDQYALATRAECYKMMGLKDKACEDYRKAADLGFVRLYEVIKEYCVE